MPPPHQRHQLAMLQLQPQLPQSPRRRPQPRKGGKQEESRKPKQRLRRRKLQLPRNEPSTLKLKFFQTFFFKILMHITDLYSFRKCAGNVIHYMKGIKHIQQ